VRRSRVSSTHARDSPSSSPRAMGRGAKLSATRRPVGALARSAAPGPGDPEADEPGAIVWQATSVDTAASAMKTTGAGRTSALTGDGVLLP